jgi:FAD/FMN-containing dehydrogenase
MARIVAAGEADFVDGTWFGADEAYVTLGTWADSGTPSDYTGMNIYYRSIQQRETDCLTVHDYLWRWDTDWFWCSRAFEVQRPAVRRLVPKRYLRSDVYWKLVGFEKRHGWKAALDRRRGLPDRGDVVQDVEVPVDRLSDFLEVFAREVPMAPVWLCPLKQRNPDVTWELYPLDPSVLYINLGFWGTVPLEPGQDRWHHDRLVEDLVEQVGGHKSLYSTSHYEPDHFHRLYGGDVYDVLKKTYDAQGRLLRLYDKAVKAK